MSLITITTKGRSNFLVVFSNAQRVISGPNLTLGKKGN